MAEKIRHFELSSVVKNMHKDLKNKITENHEISDIWDDHCTDYNNLSEYASAMHQLATEVWDAKHESDNRITWCYKYIIEYFYNGGLDKLLKKDSRRQQFHAPCSVYCEVDSQTNTLLKDDKVRLLDVGSCYNAFKKYDEFSVLGIDLYPAVESVYKCDFTKVKLISEQNFTNNGYHHHATNNFCLGICESESNENNNSSKRCDKLTIDILLENSFHVVVFCLLLDYMPTAEQRFVCCIKAHQTLMKNGILLIVSPDSRKQHRNQRITRDWKRSIESIGFSRCVYEKLTHLHCMAFRKISENPNFYVDCKRNVQQSELNCDIPLPSLIGLLKHHNDNKVSD